MKIAKKPQKFFQLLNPVWYLDALLFWSIFTSSTIFMFGLITNDSKDVLRSIINRDLEIIIQQTTQSLYKTQMSIRELDSAKQKKIISRELDTLLSNNRDLLGIRLYTKGLDKDLVLLVSSNQSISDPQKKEQVQKSFKSESYKSMIASASSTRNITRSSWRFLKSYHYQLVTPESPVVEYIAQPFTANEESFTGLYPMLVFAFDAQKIRHPFKNIDYTNGQVIGISILFATLLSLLIRRRSMQREEAVKAKLAALNILKQRDSILATLAQTGDRLLGQKDISMLLNRMLRKIDEALATKNCYAILHLPQREFSITETDTLILGTQINRPILSSIEQLEQAPWNNYRYNLKKGKPLALPYEKAHFSVRKELEKHNIKNLIILPIFINEQLRGFLILEDHLHSETSESGLIDCLRLAAELIGTAYDYEQSEKALRQSSKMQALGRMAGGVAHEFNNLLHIVTGNLDRLLSSLERSASDSEDRQIVSNVLEVAHRGEIIVEQLLKATRQHSTNLRSANLNDIVNRTLVLAKPILKNTIHINTRLTPTLPACYLDEGQISQVILNLLLNANDAIEENGTIVISTGIFKPDENPSSQEGYVFCKIQDSGTGIDLKLKDSIFDPFVTSKEPGKGTGLGLSTCKGILSAHSGYISATNVEPHGAVFTIAIPVASFSEASPDKKKITSPIRKPSGTRAIIADDEPLCLQVLTDNLHESGLKIYSANNGTEALELAQQYGLTIDWIITDWTMPGPPGAKLVAELRKLAPSALIIVTSGYILESEQNKNIDAIIKKPFQPELLLGTMQRLQIDRQRKSAFTH
ncbi:MAG: ATP-binding protein [Verrucomicrobiota bacterium]